MCRQVAGLGRGVWQACGSASLHSITTEPLTILKPGSESGVFRFLLYGCHGFGRSFTPSTFLFIFRLAGFNGRVMGRLSV